MTTSPSWTPFLRRALLVIALALAGQALPSLASPASVVRPVLAVTHLTAQDTTTALTKERLDAVTWTSGRPQISYRWHQTTGWSAWESAEQDTDVSPVGIPGTEPLWRPAGADRIEIRATGDPDQLHVVRLFDGRAEPGLGVAHAAMGRAILGTVHSRADWGADESIRRGHPSYAARVVAVVVHHTDDANGYQPSDVPAMIRADYAYHVQTRGWDDIGYNLLVDQYGGIWEGRAGGLGKATIGAHAEGFNTGTLGVALLGDLTKTPATTAAERALARVIGYAAATWRFDPTGTVTLTSRGSPRYPAGTQVTFHRVLGHQDTGITACPASLQGRLPALRALGKIALGPAPTISHITLTGAPLHAPTPVTLDAQLSRPAGWQVAITDPAGTLRAVATGTGQQPRLSWNGLTGGVGLPGTYVWAIRADDGVHDVVQRTGTFEVGLPLVAQPA